MMHISLRNRSNISVYDHIVSLKNFLENSILSIIFRNRDPS